MSESGHRAFELDNPLKIIILVGMMFIWLFWLGQTNTALNAIGGNSTIVGKFCCASTSAYGATSWLLWIMFSPFAIILFVNWVVHRIDDGPANLDSAAGGSGAGEDDGAGMLGPIERFRSGLRQTHRRPRRGLSDLARLGEDDVGEEG